MVKCLKVKTYKCNILDHNLHILIDILITIWPILNINTSNESWDPQLSNDVNDMLFRTLMNERSK